MVVPMWEKKVEYKTKEEETKDRDEAALHYVETTRPMLIKLIEKEMEEDKRQVDYALRNYAEMFYKQRSEKEWNPRLKA